MKRKPRRKKPKKRMLNKTLIGVVVVASILGLGYLIYSLSRPAPAFQYKAAIVDHLSHPDWRTANQTFVEASTAILKRGGFTVVDYYDWRNVTVNFYRKLPLHGYGLIVFRVHSAAGIIGGEQSLALFTSEPYSNKYRDEQLLDRVVMVSFIRDEPPFYFGVSPKFVRYSMKGNFANTIIIMMGCDGLETEWMAEAFWRKGARVYVSWNASVLASHTDQATIRLLQHLVAENQTVGKAVKETNNEVKPDPQYGSVLDYYPKKAGDLTIPKIAGILTINPTKTVSFTNKIRKFRLDE